MPETKPLIVQSDMSLLLDAHDPGFEEAREALGPFAQLEKSPEHFHTYRITPLSLWNAAAAGFSADDVCSALERWARYEVPQSVLYSIREISSRFGKLLLRAGANDGELLLTCEDKRVAVEISSSRRLSKWLVSTPGGFKVRLTDRGTVKRELTALGWPVKDMAPLAEGDPHPFTLRQTAASGKPFGLRPYQTDAVKAFYGDGGPGSGYGVIVLPCGAGKTVVAMAAASAIGRKTLVITTNVAAVHQWMDELADKTDLKPEDIGEYSGVHKDIRPITIATYQVLVWRPDKDSDYPHFDIFRKEKWGLIIYDEVHLLPAPVFRVVAEIQAIRRMGLTATLVREDGREEDVFSLIGPKKYDVPWKDLERKGFIAEAFCKEIRVALPEDLAIQYAVAELRNKHRIAAENPRKLDIVKDLIANHPDDSILVIGQYLNQLGIIAKELGAPLITGSVPNVERERIYADFRAGRARVIVVSKVANFAIDLPDASMAIQVSGAFGSRQEEAQRLGRILRPKERNSWFYSIVSRFTGEEEFASNRQRFLAEQGYRYTIASWDGDPWN
jgi:DNA excision repair protein ERCC-3